MKRIFEILAIIGLGYIAINIFIFILPFIIGLAVSCAVLSILFAITK